MTLNINDNLMRKSLCRMSLCWMPWGLIGSWQKKQLSLCYSCSVDKVKVGAFDSVPITLVLPAFALNANVSHLTKNLNCLYLVQVTCQVQLLWGKGVYKCNQTWVRPGMSATRHECDQAWVQLSISATVHECSQTWVQMDKIITRHECNQTWVQPYMSLTEHEYD